MRRLYAIVLLLLSTVSYGQTTPISNLTATWNNGTTTFNAIKMDITDTSSAAGSSALWLGFSATEVFRVDKDGTIYASSVAMPTISSTSTLTNKTLSFASNTITGTEAQFDTALTDGNFAFSAGAFHDGFSDFVADEHVNHTSVTLTAGTGIDGGGDISANRTFDIDSTVATLTGTQTLTNKTIVAANNTLTLFAGGANNQMVTDDGAGGLISESGLTFNGSQLAINNSTPNALLDVRGAAGGIVELSTAETTVVDGDELGRINFRAPDDGAGGDAVLVAAAIYAEADATFSASVNSTDLVFATGASQTATAKMRLTSGGNLGLGTASPAVRMHMFISGGSLPSLDGGTLYLLQSDGAPGFSAAMSVIAGNQAKVSLFLGDTQTQNRGAIRYDNAAEQLSLWSGGIQRLTIDSQGEVGVNKTVIVAQVDITAKASTVGLNIDLDASPDAAVTVTDSSSVVVFAVESDGETTTEFDSVFNTTEGGTARLTRQTAHETHTLTLGATSDTTTISVPSGARLLGVSMNVNATVADDAGDDTWDATWLTGSSQGIVTGASPTLDTKVDVMFPGNVNDVTTATTQIQFSPNGGNFSAGVIEIVAYYESLTSLADL